MLKIASIVLAVLLIAAATTVVTGKAINAQKYKIRSAAGIQTSGYIVLGGIEQYIQIRGQDMSNPVMIVLHGGPGSTMAYYSYYWQTPLEENYTIVHWDQRGSGNTYYRNPKNSETATLELLLSDLDELVDHIRTNFGRETVVIMGHSWGTLLGGIYAGKHPEKVSRYVAVGQIVSARGGEETAIREAIRLAGGSGETQAANEMEKKLRAIYEAGGFDISEATSLRKLAANYLPAGDGMPAAGQVGMGLFSPYMTWNDLRWYLAPAIDFERYIEPNEKLFDALFRGDGFSMYDDAVRYEIPVTFISGDCDWVTPYTEVQEYFEAVSAPEKELILIKNTGHTPFLDRPAEFAKILLDALEGQDAQ